MLELHGWGELGDELQRAVEARASGRRWGTLVDDDVLHTFAVVAEPDRVAGEIRRRYGTLIDRVSFYTAYEIDAEVWEPIVRELREAE